MADPHPDERFRQYLMFLAELQAGPELRAKLDIEGVVQQTLIEAWQVGATNGERMPFLRKVLAHNLGDELRKLRTEKRDIGRERSLESELDQSSARLAVFLAADQSSPSQRVGREEQALQLVTALSELPEDQRQALIWQHWHGWSLAVIGEQMGRTQASVAGLIRRGLQALREIMAEKRS